MPLCQWLDFGQPCDRARLILWLIALHLRVFLYSSLRFTPGLAAPQNLFTKTFLLVHSCIKTGEITQIRQNSLLQIVYDVIDQGWRDSKSWNLSPCPLYKFMLTVSVECLTVQFIRRTDD